MTSTAAGIDDGTKRVCSSVSASGGGSRDVNEYDRTAGYAIAITVPDLVGVLAQFVARPDRAAQVRDGLLRVVDGARTEDGSLDYDLYQVERTSPRCSTCWPTGLTRNRPPRT